MMAGNGFVIDGALQPELRHVAHAAWILKNAGPGTVRGRAVVACGRGILDKRRERLRNDFRFRAKVEQLTGPDFRIAKNRLNVAHDLGSAFFRTRIGILLGGCNLSHAVLNRTLRIAEPAKNRIHFAFDAGDFTQADLVDLFRRQVGRCVLPKKVGVSGIAALEPPESGIVSGLRDLPLELGDCFSPGGIDPVDDDLLRFRAQFRTLARRQLRNRIHFLSKHRHEGILPRQRIDEILHLIDRDFEDKFRRKDSLARQSARFRNGFVNTNGRLF